MFIAAYDFDGNKVWEVRPGVFSSMHGYCSSPVIWKDKVIVNGDHDGPSYIVALDRTTGQTIWKTPRPNRTRSYCTPIIRQIDGRNQMVLSGTMCVASYEPDTGEQHWLIDGPTVCIGRIFGRKLGGDGVHERRLPRCDNRIQGWGHAKTGAHGREIAGR